MNPSVGGGAYFQAKGTVVAVEQGGFAGTVQVAGLDSLRIDSDELETVVPSEGGAVAVLRGQHRGATGVLVKIHVERFCADVQVGGLLLQGLEYTDLSRYKGLA